MAKWKDGLQNVAWYVVQTKTLVLETYSNILILFRGYPKTTDLSLSVPLELLNMVELKHCFKIQYLPHTHNIFFIKEYQPETRNILIRIIHFLVKIEYEY